MIVLTWGLAIGGIGCAHFRRQQECVPVRENPDPVRQRGFIVLYRQGVDPFATTARYSKKYSFTPTHVYERAIRGFAADFSPTVLAKIRCEPEILRIEPDTPQNVLTQALRTSKFAIQ